MQLRLELGSFSMCEVLEETMGIVTAMCTHSRAPSKVPERSAARPRARVWAGAARPPRARENFAPYPPCGVLKKSEPSHLSLDNAVAVLVAHRRSRSGLFDGDVPCAVLATGGRLGTPASAADPTPTHVKHALS